MAIREFSFKWLEMPYYLVHSYAGLSQAQGRFLSRNSGGDYQGFHHNFALLSINAAIVEGILRSVMSFHLFEIEQDSIQKGVASGKTAPDLLERNFARLRVEVDSSDTWSKLKERFKFIFGKSLSDVVTKPVMTEIEHLFIIRNRSAHGSSIQLPSTPVTSDDEYLFALQQKLEALTNFLISKYSVKDFYEGLGRTEVPPDFWDLTKRFASGLKTVAPLDKRLQKTFDAIEKYSFGHAYIGP